MSDPHIKNSGLNEVDNDLFKMVQKNNYQSIDTLVQMKLKDGIFTYKGQESNESAYNKYVYSSNI
jgi:hypothetical protein